MHCHIVVVSISTFDRHIICSRNSHVAISRDFRSNRSVGICNMPGFQYVAGDTLWMSKCSISVMIRDSLKKKGIDREPTFDEIVEAKIILAESLSKNASGVLVDGYYGVWNSVASFNIPKTVGILVRVEQSGGGKNKVNAPLGGFEPGWSVEKIKGIGADAVKLLAQYEPTEPNSAEHQFEFIQQVYEDCKKHDILMLLETVAFPFGDEKKDSKSFINRKAETVIESAHQLSRFCDIYKAEFPGHLGNESDAQLEKKHKARDAVI